MSLLFKTFGLLTLITIASAHDFIDCQKNQTMILKITSYLPSNSAHHLLTKGQCSVLAPYYSWYDLSGHPNQSSMIEIYTSPCDPKDFIWKEDGTYLKAQVIYQSEISNNGSILGLHYTCTPIVLTLY